MNDQADEIRQAGEVAEGFRIHQKPGQGRSRKMDSSCTESTGDHHPFSRSFTGSHKDCPPGNRSCEGTRKMTSVDVTARKWPKGWELELDEENVTQVSSLSHARQQVRDYLDTIAPDISHAEWKINIVFSDPNLAEEINNAKEIANTAAELQIEAGRRSREVVRELRSRGLSVSEVAAALDISKGRASQLEHGRKLATR